MVDIPDIPGLPYAISIFPDRDNIIIVDSEDNELKLLKFENIYIREEQTTFADDINLNFSNALVLEKTVEDSILLIEEEASKTDRLTDVNHNHNTLNSVATGAIKSANFAEKSTFQSGDLIGSYNIIRFNEFTVKNLTINTAGIVSGECDPCANYIQNGTVCLSPGTYKIKSTVTISPEVIAQWKIPQFTAFNLLSAFESIWSFISFYKISSPKQFTLNGDSACTFNKAGPSVTLNLLGFVYVDSIAEYGIVVNTIGKLIPGAYTSSILDSLSSIGSGVDYLDKSQITQSHLVIEQISDQDVLSPTTDSTVVRVNREFIYPDKIRVMYKSGWLLKIVEAPDTTDFPTTDLQKLKLLPYIEDDLYDKPIGSARAYFSDPASINGTINVGDVARYRPQLPDDNNNVPSNADSYDLRDTTFEKLTPGWYGYIESDSEKGVGEFYDVIFRVDKESVVTAVRQL